MKISVRQPDPKSYNASIRSVDTFEKTIASAVHNVFINVSDELPYTTLYSTYALLLLQELLEDVQAFYFVLSNWNNSYNTSKFTFPTAKPFREEKKIQKDPEVKIIDKSRTVVSSDDEEDLLRSSTNSITIIEKNSSDIQKGIYNTLDDVVSYKETDYEDLITMIYNFQYIMDVLFLVYDYIRNDKGKFSLLMKLKSRANPIIDEVPIFPALPYVCYYDFWSWRQLYPTALTLPKECSEKEYTIYYIDPLLHIEEMQTESQKTFNPPQYWSRYDSAGYGFCWRTGEKAYYSGTECYIVKGYWWGSIGGDIWSDHFFEFIGYCTIAMPDFSFDYVVINDILQVVYPIIITSMKGLVQTVRVVTSRKDHKPGDYSDID